MDVVDVARGTGGRWNRAVTTAFRGRPNVLLSCLDLHSLALLLTVYRASLFSGLTKPLAGRDLAGRGVAGAANRLRGCSVALRV